MSQGSPETQEQSPKRNKPKGEETASTPAEERRNVKPRPENLGAMRRSEKGEGGGTSSIAKMNGPKGETGKEKEERKPKTAKREKDWRT